MHAGGRKLQSVVESKAQDTGEKKKHHTSENLLFVDAENGNQPFVKDLRQKILYY